MGLAVQSSELLQHKRHDRSTAQVGHPGREAAEDTVDVELAWQPAAGPDLNRGEESSQAVAVEQVRGKIEPAQSLGQYSVDDESARLRLRVDSSLPENALFIPVEDGGRPPHQQAIPRQLQDTAAVAYATRNRRQRDAGLRVEGI